MNMGWNANPHGKHVFGGFNRKSGQFCTDMPFEFENIILCKFDVIPRGDYGRR